MSVIGTYARLSPQDLEACRSNRDWSEALWGKKLASAEVIDLDKAWDGIAWLLSQLPAPAPESTTAGASFQLVRSPAPLLRGEGGTKEPRLQAPYGPASSLSAAQVATLSAWLGGLSVDDLRRVFDAAAMEEADVYPNIWQEEGVKAVEEYLWPNFESLRALLSRAAQLGQPVLVFFT